MVQLDFFYHNRTPSYASMSTISGHAINRQYRQVFFGLRWHVRYKTAVNNRGRYTKGGPDCFVLTLAPLLFIPASAAG